MVLSGAVAGGKCSFSNHIDDASLSIDPQTETALKAKGVTDAQIQQQLQLSTTQAKQSIGMTTNCTFTTTYLTQMLTNWQKGNLSSSILIQGIVLLLMQMVRQLKFILVTQQFP